MRILGIETSCDETTISLIEAKGRLPDVSITVLADAVLSQAALHSGFGGVFPMMAKREHAKHLIPMLKKILAESNSSESRNRKQESGIETSKRSEVLENIRMMLEREPELLKQFVEFIPTIERPAIDRIAVTYGPGLEPALWVGINFARALGTIWNIPVIPVNHMEGHIFSALLRKENTNEKSRTTNNAKNYELQAISFPALALLISGGHTELVVMSGWGHYERIGETRDDAVGEAFDKVARLLGLPYPGGPQISALAQKARNDKKKVRSFSLPRPMLRSNDYDFSFAGLKTAVLYLLKKLPALSEEMKCEIAREFENAVIEVLAAKTRRALDEYGAKSLIAGGGVIANTEIRRAMEKLARSRGVSLFLPTADLATDNSLMIAIAGYLDSARNAKKAAPPEKLTAQGTARL